MVSGSVLFALWITGFQPVAGTEQQVAAATGRLEGGGWSVTATGAVSGDAGAPLFGALLQPPKSPIVAMAATPDGRGYWLASADGVVFHFGDARSYGSAAADYFKKPIVAMAATPDGRGYWLASADGVVFHFGDARSYGSAAADYFKKPIVAMAATPDGRGYWLASADGVVFHFGDARSYGSAAADHFKKPIVAMAATPDGRGYWLASADGVVFHFGDARSYRSSSLRSHQTVAGIIADFGGYRVVTQGGAWLNFTQPTSAPRVLVTGNHLSSGGSTLRLLGVDASGTEDACTSSINVSWVPLTATEASAIAAWHVNTVRVPLNEDCWLGINGLPRDFSPGVYRRAVVQWVDAINDAGMVAVLDLHWSAPASIVANREWPMADANHSLDFWHQVARTFADDPSVMFDLFNEPSLGSKHPTSRDWACLLDGCMASFDGTSYRVAGMQQLLDVVRSAGAVQPAIVAGLNWSGDPCGIYDSPTAAATCQSIVYKPNDPEGQIVISFHTYNWTLCNNQSCWDKSVLKAARTVPVVTTELGEEDCSATYIDDYMSWADSHRLSYLAWSWSPPVSGETCAQANMSLISGQGGDPNTVAPAGAAFAAHLAYLSREK